MSLKGNDIRQRIKAYLLFKRNLHTWVGTVAVNFFKDRFRREGWQDSGFSKWPSRKDEGNKRRNKRRGTLIKTGALLRSIRITSHGEGFVRVGSDRKYAQVHNEGGQINVSMKVRRHTRRIYQTKTIKTTDKAGKERNRKKRSFSGEVNVRAHTRSVNFRMPQRRFMGDSKLLNRRIEAQLQKNLNTIFND
jgi:phage gpG-like protein